MKPVHKRSALNRLKTVRGHLDAVIAMVDEERYCPQILKQVSALQGSLERVNRVLLQKLAEKIEALCNDLGITIFLIEHDMDLVTRLCNPVIVMSEGHVLAEGTPDEVKRNESVLEAYLGGQYR